MSPGNLVSRMPILIWEGRTVASVVQESKMKKLLMSVLVAVLGVGFVVADADAKRLGGARSSGMQREMPARQTPQSPPAQQAPVAAPATAGAAAATAAAPRRNWLGPIAGIAAGLGLAALMSHLGFGEQFANFLMLALLAVVALVAVRWLMGRFAGKRSGAMPNGLQFAGAGTPGARPMQPNAVPLAPVAAAGSGGTSFGGSGGMASGMAVRTGAPRLPADFDARGFERIAKMIFIRLQAANDAGDLEDLRQFSTPEMFAEFKLDLQDRKGATQKTDVEQLDAEVLDVVEEPGRQVVSVRFHGLIREDAAVPAAPFDEVWHLVKPTDGSREWTIAGIGQSA